MLWHIWGDAGHTTVYREMSVIVCTSQPRAGVDTAELQQCVCARAENRQQQFQQSVARHISAASIQNLSPPTLIKMMSLSPEDKLTWSKAYDEEFDGLTVIFLFSS